MGTRNIPINRGAKETDAYGSCSIPVTKDLCQAHGVSSSAGFSKTAADISYLLSHKLNLQFHRRLQAQRFYRLQALRGTGKIPPRRRAQESQKAALSRMTKNS